MGERRKKTLEKWVHNVERVIDTPSTVENRRLKEDEPKDLLWHLPASLRVLDF